MRRDKFKDRLDKAKNLFVQELMDGCNECKGGRLCKDHEDMVIDMVLRPKKCVPFQTFLKQIGFVVPPKGGTGARVPKRKKK